MTLDIKKITARKLLYKDKTILRYFESVKNDSKNNNVVKDNERKKLTLLLTHIAENVPYYKEIMGGLNLKKSDIVNHPNEILSQLPITDKDFIKTKGNLFFSNDMKERSSYVNYTGGSSGEPFKVHQDELFHQYNEAYFLLAKSWRGWELGDNELLLWGSDKDTFSGKKSTKSKLKDFVYNRLTLNTFSMSSSTMDEYIKTIRRRNPTMIRSYAQSVYQIAQYMLKKNLSFNFKGSIHTGAGTLYDFMRNDIEAAFGTTKIFNHYGSRELGSIASECSDHTGLHVFSDHNYVEILNNDNQPVENGEIGNIVVTGLNNYSMPLVRYKIGDLGVKSDDNCKCGVGYPKLSKVVGRATDILKSKDGSIVLPEYFIHLIGVSSNDGSILKFQVIQEHLDFVLIKLVTRGNKHLSQTLKRDLIDKIGLVLKDVKVQFEYLEDIPKTKSGKYLYIVSKLK